MNPILHEVIMKKKNEKTVEMVKDGHKITVPESRVQGRKNHGYQVIEKKEGGK
jgi:hypothetical protein